MSWYVTTECKQLTHLNKQNCSQLNQTVRMAQTRFSPSTCPADAPTLTQSLNTHMHPPAASLNNCGGSSNSNNRTNISNGASIQQEEQTQEIVCCCIVNATRYQGILRSAKCVIRVPIRRLCKSMRAQVPKGTQTMHFAIYLYVCVCICIYVCIYIYICVCMYVCIYKHVRPIICNSIASRKFSYTTCLKTRFSFPEKYEVLSY